MSKVIGAARCFVVVCLALATARPAAAEDDQSFVIRNFRLESGVVLPEAHIDYLTFGTLDAARGNAIVLPSHYMANANGYAALIGKDKALDPAKYFLVTTELFGNGRSSSPSNTPEPFHGPRFPLTTIRDNVAAVHALLTEKFGIRKLKAAIGFSMGAEQVLQLAVTYPDFAERIVATSGTAKTYPTNFMMLESAVTALETDPAFKGGDYAAPPEKGLFALRTVMISWVHAQEYWRQELWRNDFPNIASFKEVYARSQASLLAGADANDIILQMRTWQAHDVGTSPGFNGDTQAALRSIRVPVLDMPSESDLYFTAVSARDEARAITHGIFRPVPSLLGHPGGLAGKGKEGEFLSANIRAFLEGRPLSE